VPRSLENAAGGRIIGSLAKVHSYRKVTKIVRRVNFGALARPTIRKHFYFIVEPITGGVRLIKANI
jgi:hypothetical protein